MPDRAGDLRAELTARTAPAVLAEVSLALGVAPGGPFPAVAGYHLELSDQLLVLTAVAGRQLVRMEMTADGRVLHVAVPLGRVCRVAEALEGSAVTVVVEVDADRRALTVTGASAASGDDAREMRLEGALLPSAFVLGADGPDAGRLREFARALRVEIAG